MVAGFKGGEFPGNNAAARNEPRSSELLALRLLSQTLTIVIQPVPPFKKGSDDE